MFKRLPEIFLTNAAFEEMTAKQAYQQVHNDQTTFRNFR